MSGLGEWIPRDVEPAGAGKKLVGVLPFLEEIYERVELRRVFRSDVGSLTYEVLRARDTANLAIHGFAAEAGIDYDRACDKPCRFQQLMTAIGKIRYDLHRRKVAWVFPEIKKFAQFKVRRQSNGIKLARMVERSLVMVIEILLHGIVCFHGNAY